MAWVPVYIGGRRDRARSAVESLRRSRGHGRRQRCRPPSRRRRSRAPRGAMGLACRVRRRPLRLGVPDRAGHRGRGREGESRRRRNLGGRPAAHRQVLQGGRLKMRDMDDYHMQVTKIAFDPYREGRILVGTRDAGVICTVDNGETWRTIKNSDRIDYVTGFHFYPNGAVHIASWGHGLWFLQATRAAPRPIRRTGTTSTGRRPDERRRSCSKAEEPPAPRGVAEPGVAKLFVTSSVPSSGIAGLGPDNVLQVSGRGFPAGQEVTLRIREGSCSRNEAAQEESSSEAYGSARTASSRRPCNCPRTCPMGRTPSRPSPERRPASSPPPISSSPIPTNPSRESDRRVWCPDYGLAASATACKNHGIKGQGYGGPARRTAGSRPTNDRFSGSELRAGSEVRREGAGSLGHRSPQRETPDHVAVALRSKPSAKTAARSPR